MRKYDDIKIGESAKLTHKITQKDVEKFVDLTGDDNKLHIDKEYAKKTSFKKPVVHGMLGASFISTVIGTKLPGDGALWHAQNLEFILPVRLGDTITVELKVIKKIDSGKTIVLETNIFNQNKQKVTSGTAKVKLIEKQSSDLNETNNNTTKKKIALVVGATGGIGYATCLKLAKNGYDIAIHYHSNEEKAQELKAAVEKEKCNSIIVRADINNDAEISDMMNSITRYLGDITTLINCSTIPVPNIGFDDLEWDDFQSHINVNIKGMFNLIKAAKPIMTRNKFGKIIAISTQFVDAPKKEFCNYITAKSGLCGLIRSLAVELAPKGIRLNLISPGVTDTDLIADMPEKSRLLLAAQTPLRRLALADDIADAICYLSSRKSNFINGETIRINGGQVIL